MNIYSLEEIDISLENDEISSQEAAFMLGYLDSEPAEVNIY